MTYTYEQAIADASKYVKRRSDLPTEVGWYVCEDTCLIQQYEMRWFDGVEFGSSCHQTYADEGLLDVMAASPAAFEILGWCEPLWVK